MTACGLLIAACDAHAPSFTSAPELEARTATPVPGSQAATSFVAPASGDQEVPAVETNARGNTTFQLREDGLHFRLTVANLHNITQAHIHYGPAGVNGPVLVWLFPDGPPDTLIEGRFSGVIAEGVITEDDLVGPPQLEVNTLEVLLELMREEYAYVNVHTQQFPPGEIRGQIRPAGRR
jgi:hypothetical protein